MYQAIAFSATIFNLCLTLGSQFFCQDGLPIPSRSSTVFGQKLKPFFLAVIILKLKVCPIDHNSYILIRSDKTSASESLYGGQFTLSTQLIKPNYLAILPPTQHHSFFRNLPPLFKKYSLTMNMFLLTGFAA